MAATLTLRVPTGVPLTNLQVDNNFSSLNTWGNTINSNVGILSNLTTSSTSNVVDAINTIKGGNLSIFASTTSVQLAGIISDETGTGNLVFATSAVLTTPNIGTPSYAILTSATGLPISTGVSGLGANQTTKLAANAITGVAASTYGSTSIIPVITVDTYGRITLASNATPTFATTGKAIAMAMIFGS